ncbi:protein translocase subunit SecD [uncultured Varibaculum sp.]|uniref:protein translocase subunit SecD n=1 Tax=uncultured Varibaculum sp. TaxID=413896 RepID=UPI00258523C4|nr:protein translocase subunit SecD [uncultured Varibaculum sp.]
MAKKKYHAGRTLAFFLVLVLALTGTLMVGVLTKKAKPTPSLALDLEGGTQLILTPKGNAASGAKRAVTAEDITQAIEVIRQRVDASGVSEAEITSQGNSNILVSLPGNPSKETLDLVRQSAELYFRAVLRSAPGVPQSVMAQQAEQQQAGKKQAKPANIDPEAFAKQMADLDHDGKISDKRATQPKDNSDDAWITEKVLQEFYAKDCQQKSSREGGSSGDIKKPLVACSSEGHEKYILSPAEVSGARISSAESGMGTGASGQSTGQWIVSLSFDKQGASQFADITTRMMKYRGQPVAGENGLPPGQNNDKNRFAIVLDGLVVSAPGVNNAITNGKAEISGSFTRSSSTALANQLKFGSLPLNFDVQSEQQVSATLGADQLRYGVIAGIIGLILVVFYLIWQYRGLAVVAVGSLVSAGVLLYLTLTLLSWSMGYRLSLAGIAGVIVSIGTTADSFIIYFERIRDEVRDGKALSSAVSVGWDRAKRTIVTSDLVNVLAACVLYFLAVGGVQGFAFTLGITTLIDLALIFIFTHPMMVWLLRFKFFGEGHKLSGLDPEHLGAQRGTYRYVGAGQVRKIRSVYKSKPEEDAGKSDNDKAEEPAAEKADSNEDDVPADELASVSATDQEEEK